LYGFGFEEYYFIIFYSILAYIEVQTLTIQIREEQEIF